MRPSAPCRRQGARSESDLPAARSRADRSRDHPRRIKGRRAHRDRAFAQSDVLRSRTVAICPQGQGVAVMQETARLVIGGPLTADLNGSTPTGYLLPGLRAGQRAGTDWSLGCKLQPPARVMSCWLRERPVRSVTIVGPRKSDRFDTWGAHVGRLQATRRPVDRTHAWCRSQDAAMASGRLRQVRTLLPGLTIARYGEPYDLARKSSRCRSPSTNRHRPPAQWKTC